MTRAQRIAAGIAALLGLSAGTATIVTNDWLEDEGWRLTVYLDSIGRPTVCAGHTGPEVVMGDTWTEDECIAVTIADIVKHGKPVLDALIAATEGEKAAYIGFGGNAGVAAFLNSTMRELQNRGERAQACLQFRRWVYVTINGRKVDCRTAGRLCPGLPERRERQLKRCMQDVEPPPPPPRPTAELRYFYIAGAPHVQHPVQHLLADRAAVGGHGDRLLVAPVDQHHRRLGGLVLREGPARHHLGAGLDRIPGRRHRRSLAALAHAA